MGCRRFLPAFLCDVCGAFEKSIITALNEIDRYYKAMGNAMQVMENERKTLTSSIRGIAKSHGAGGNTGKGKE